ncbi:MAG TPA: hypothetical protein VK694_00585 [Verrucomicrobiae bacterium]|nr:hypothetical protein [Verrucomicrobiae bacterium]
MNIDLKTITTKLAPLAQKLRKYTVFIFVMFFLGLYAFMLLRINTLTRQEPSDEAITEKLQTVKRPKLDKKLAEKIENLQAQNVEVKSLFEQARQNPFAE